jgi:hypothetical protein
VSPYPTQGIGVKRRELWGGRRDDCGQPGRGSAERSSSGLLRATERLSPAIALGADRGPRTSLERRDLGNSDVHAPVFVRRGRGSPVTVAPSSPRPSAVGRSWSTGARAVAKHRPQRPGPGAWPPGRVRFVQSLEELEDPSLRRKPFVVGGGPHGVAKHRRERRVRGPGPLAHVRFRTVAGGVRRSVATRQAVRLPRRSARPRRRCDCELHGARVRCPLGAMSYAEHCVLPARGSSLAPILGRRPAASAPMWRSPETKRNSLAALLSR